MYDARGRRVSKTSSAGTFDYLYDTGGQQIGDVSSAGWHRGEVYANGRHLATYRIGTTFFNFADWLGTERVRTAVTGTGCETITSLPFGDGQVNSGSCADAGPMHFTGKERDVESGLDDFEARQYSSALGRFLQPDEFAGGPVDLFGVTDSPGPLPYADIADPRSLNKYGYTYNNPLRYTDPNGHDVWDFVGGAVNAFGSDFFGGAGRQESSNGDYKGGQAVGDFGAAAVGTGETILGAGGEVGGLVLDATGVGAFLGVPAGVVSTAAIVQGATGASVGLAYLQKASNDSKGGGRDEKKSNPDRVQSAKDNIGELKNQRDTLKSQANKTPDDKAKLDKLNKAIKRETNRMKKSETHSRKEKGPQQ